MGKFRGVVLPVLRLLVWTVIAIALCVIAFGGNRSSADDALTPEVGSSSSVVPVTTGDINSVINVSGTVEADPATAVKATAAGTVTRVQAAKGESVNDGDPLFTVRFALPTAEPTTAADGTVTTPTTRYDTRVVRATADGTLSSFDILKDQEIEVGAEVAKIDPGTLTVVAPLTQAQQFRLLKPPAAAQAQAPGGPAPFQCSNVRTAASESDDDSSNNNNQTPGVDPMTGQAVAETTAQVKCSVPGGTTVFAGMSVNLTLDTGSVTGALTLPVTAVQGTVGNGKVWVPGPNDGDPLEKAVTLGLTDGTSVQIVKGLGEGEEVLEFAPVPDDDTDSGESGDVGPDGMPVG